MPPSDPPEIFLAAAPGLERWLAAEAAEAGFAEPRTVPGGVLIRGGMATARRACLTLRGAQRVLIRLAEFRALHPAQLDKRARRVAWGDWLRPDVPVRVEATSHRSRIWHAGAAASRVERALAEATGAPVARSAEGGPLRLSVRLDDDLCTLSLDVGGGPLHLRGTKADVGAAPLRETTAALLLRAAGRTSGEPFVDPMCGSGTLALEAAAADAGRLPGEGRAFAFERLARHDPAAWADERAALIAAARAAAPPPPEAPAIHASDRDAAAIEVARAAAEATNLLDYIAFSRRSVTALERPAGPPGLVLVNPPWGARLGEAEALRALHATLGRVLAGRFAGWRVGLFTPDAALARATGLPFGPPGPPIPAGKLKPRLHLSGPLP